MEKKSNNSSLKAIQLKELKKSILEQKFEAKVMLVCGNSAKKTFVYKELYSMTNIYEFNDFEPNPSYKSVVRGVEFYNKNSCNTIVAIGGGSAIDVAKTIKLYKDIINDDTKENFFRIKNISEKDIKAPVPKLIAIPTTAGSGSEATRFAVIYYEDEKQSIDNKLCLPNKTFLFPQLLETLPLYQKETTMLDAWSHCVESFWAVNATEESKKMAQRALCLIYGNAKSYFDNELRGNGQMQKAANLAGRAINITRTTAGHAMCYMLTKKYGIPHGHGAALCTKEIWKYMENECMKSNSIENKCMTNNSIENENIENNHKKNKDTKQSTKNERIKIDLTNLNRIITELENKYGKIEIPRPKEFDKNWSDEEIRESAKELALTVNAERLKNHPMKMSTDVIQNLYEKILRGY